MPQQPSGSGGCPTGGCSSCRCATASSCARRRPASSSSTPTCRAIATGHVNDMVVGADGIAYVGNFGFDLMARRGDRSRRRWPRIDPDGTVSVASEPLLFPNGSAITPDGSTLDHQRVVRQPA